MAAIPASSICNREESAPAGQRAINRDLAWRYGVSVGGLNERLETALNGASVPRSDGQRTYDSRPLREEDVVGRGYPRHARRHG
jgi:hypothetical protein